MNVFQQVMFIFACAATFILLIQIVLMFIGGAETDASDISDVGDVADAGDLADAGGLADMDGIADADGTDVFDASEAVGSSDISSGVDGSSNDVRIQSGGARFGFKLFSLRSILAFIAVAGWVGYTVGYALDWYYALIIALVCGAAAACAMAAALVGMERLQINGNIDSNNAIGKIGTVYLTVPANRSGQGKINVIVQERYVEYQAVTDSPEPIPTGSEIKVIGKSGMDILVVEPCNQIEKTAKSAE